MKTTVWATIVILWCGLIYYFSQSPLFTAINTDGTIAAFFGIADWKVAYAVNYVARKSAHFILFAVLAVFIRIVLCATPGASWVAWLGASAYGVTDEIHQAYVPGRGSSVMDAAIDSAGAGAGLLVYMLVARKLRKQR